jgi:uncharacterized repeat protein (TIGR03803 family)
MKRLSLGKIARIVVMFCAVSGVAAFAQTFTSLASFDLTDGRFPSLGPLVQGANGNFYGTTEAGGANNNGTIFEVTSAGTVTTFYSFVCCHDGTTPITGLVQTANGNFYGTTGDEGAHGSGTVFEISAEGKLITLYSFCAQTNSEGCTDGSDQEGTLVQGYDGDFYSTTTYGGANGGGTVFKITPTGTLTTLYSFCSLANCADGKFPAAGLVQATDGKFYGTTVEGGNNGGGTIFSITPAGKLTTLHGFCSVTDCADGGPSPQSALVQAADGNFYGTTVGGGTHGGGMVFEFTLAGNLTTLYNFCSQPSCTDGQLVQAGLIQATDGNFYGTTQVGGAYAGGTIFEITPLGVLTTLYSFCSQLYCADGTEPLAGLVQATDGTLYGTTTYGGGIPSCGGQGCGTVFSLSMGLAPFVETLPVARKVGEPVTILGNNLTGTTGVTFNGTAATFTVVSDTAIKTTVPTGATTGPVEVVTPSGTLTSNIPFRVEP